MKSKSLLVALTLLVAALILSACGGGVDTSKVGTEEQPIKVMFVPSVDATEIVAGGDLLADTLHTATGYYFEVVVPTSYAATLEEMCASPTDSMAFIPGLGYVLANQLCGVDVGAKATRFGLDWYAAQFIVRRDSGLTSLADLEGKKWAYPDPSSTSGYLYPQYAFQEAGVTPGETFEAGGHSNVVRSVYNSEADFGTTFWSPANVDGVSLGVTLGAASLDDPDIPADLLSSCALNEDESKILCGNYEPRDARRNIRSEAPDVMQTLGIVAVTPAIANDTVSFGPDFPSDVREAILTALFDFAANDPDGFATAMDPYSWTAVGPATDAEYDDIRNAVSASGFSLEDLGE